MVRYVYSWQWRNFKINLHLWKVNSPSGQDKFQICCNDMHLVGFLTNFAVLRVFLWISRDSADITEFRGSATARNIRSPADDVSLTNLDHRNSFRPHFTAVKSTFSLKKIQIKKQRFQDELKFHSGLSAIIPSGIHTRIGRRRLCIN